MIDYVAALQAAVLLLSVNPGRCPGLVCCALSGLLAM